MLSIEKALEMGRELEADSATALDIAAKLREVDQAARRDAFSTVLEIIRAPMRGRGRAGPHSIERGKGQWERWWGIDIEESVAQYQLEQGAEKT